MIDPTSPTIITTRFRGVDHFIPNNFGLSLNDWIVLSLIILVGIPSSLIYEREYRRKREIDRNLPYLLREISDAQKIGMSLPRAITEAAKREYGPLTLELKKFAAKISWGVPFPKAMETFMRRMDTPLARQASILILEAERSGGTLERIFESAEKFVQEILNIQSEREGQMRPYLYIVYIAFFIFIAVIVILYQAFFLPFSQEGINVGIGSLSGKITIPLGPLTALFLWFVIVEGFFSGLVAGKMSSGTVKHGLIHSSIMMLVGYIIFKAFITQDFFGITL